MLIALDTNILVYAEKIDDEARYRSTIDLLRNLAGRVVLPVQALGELHRVLRRKKKMEAPAVASLVERWFDFAPLAETTAPVFLQASAIVAMHGLDIWDSVILAASAEAGCNLLLSEDMQDGFVWRGVTIANPYASQLHPLLQSALMS